MLILSRKQGEEIIIDGKIKIVVTRLDSGRVSIGIEAPRDIPVVRGELKVNDPAEKIEASAEERKATLANFVQMHKLVG